MGRSKFASFAALELPELHTEIDNREKELLQLRMMNATRQLQDTSKFKTLRHEIAQLKTVLNDRSKGVSPVAADNKEAEE